MKEGFYSSSSKNLAMDFRYGSKNNFVSLLK